MRDFAYHRATSLADAKQALSAGGALALAGGTTLVDLAKLNVLVPEVVVDLSALPGMADIALRDGRLHIGALARMTDVARHPDIRSLAPAIASALELAASGQIRNMATIGGNLLQRTRCAYYRDPSTYARCNKRVPGSGCAAKDGVTPNHAILGTTDACIAAYPGDLGVALAALDATVHTDMRVVPFADLFLPPGSESGRETILDADEIITGVSIEPGSATARSTFLKIRDRQSYEFAAVSVAVALDLAGPRPDIRIAVGGVSARPWRLGAVEDALRQGSLDLTRIRAAAGLAGVGARCTPDNGFKLILLTRAVERALTTALDLS